MVKLYNLQYRGKDIGSERGYYYEFSNDPGGPIVTVILPEKPANDYLVVFMADGRVIRG